MYVIHFFNLIHHSRKPGKRKLPFFLLFLCLSAGCGQAGESRAISAFRTFPDSSLAFPEEEEVFREDTNQYGNTTGNQYNDGVFLTDKSQNAFYFFNSYENALCRTDIETGDTAFLAEGLLAQMQLQEGMLYGTLVDLEGGSSRLISLNPADGQQNVLRENPPQYLQLVNGVFYFTDWEENNLRKLPADGGEEEILLDEQVYYPVVYKDWIFFQRDSDGESLYRMPKDGGELLKLNDMKTYSPQIYRDRIYYMAQEEQVYTLRSIGINGEDEQVLLEAHAWNLNLYNGRLYFVEEGNEKVISYLNLDEEAPEKQTLDLKEPIARKMKEISGEPVDFTVTSYAGLNFSENYLLFMLNSNVEGTPYQDEFLYDMEKEEILILTDFCRPAGDGSQAPAEDGSQARTPEASQTPDAAQSPAAPAGSSKDAEARAVAQAIADSIPPGSDLERVRAAAAAVAGYCSQATYTTEDPDYSTAYGVFCKGVYTCAGATRALGLVLDCMGYSWSHANANQWSHQWCELTMDGQAGWADGQGGIADYGACPFATGGTYTAPDGRTWQTR